jgi:hypothetical protein
MLWLVSTTKAKSTFGAVIRILHKRFFATAPVYASPIGENSVKNGVFEVLCDLVSTDYFVRINKDPCGNDPQASVTIINQPITA